jgi:hypothetical protein
MRALLGIAAVAAGLGLCACQYSPDMVTRSVSYNEAIANSTNSVLLLNALRASERLPTYYTRMTANTATAAVTPLISMALPLGPGAVKKGFGPNFQFTDTSQNQMTLQNLDDQKFMRGVLTPVPLDVLSFYLRQGWPRELLFLMTVSRLTVPAALAARLEDAFDAHCAAAPGSDYCNAQVPVEDRPATGQYVTQQLKACITAGRYDSGSHGEYLFENYPTNPEETACFQWMLRVFISFDPTPKTTETVKLVARDVAPGAREGLGAVADLDKDNLIVVPGSAKGTYNVCKRTKVTGLGLSSLPDTATARREPTAAPPLESDSDIQILLPASRAAPAADCDSAASAAKTGADHAPPGMQLSTRSLDGMVYYLGEIIRAEHQVKDSVMPDTAPPDSSGVSLWVWNTSSRAYSDWDLFSVRRGGAPDSNLIAVDFHGEAYYVPSACDDSGDCAQGAERHRSLQVLALLNQIWGLQKEQSELPIAPTVTVIGP